MTISFSEAASATPGQTKLESDGELYQHAKRPQWGVAILVRGDHHVRSYQFEDGRLRKFTRGYFDLMERVDEIRGSRDHVVAELESAVRNGGAPEEFEVLKPVTSFEAQLALFLELYPGGFADPEWVSAHRGTPSGSDLKRHREPVKRAIQETLSPERCREMRTEGRHGDLLEAVRGILGRTDLVTLAQVRVLEGLDPEKTRSLAEAFADILHGDAEYHVRFRGFLRILGGIVGEHPSWRLSTALQALAFPHEHVCVRHSAFQRQAAIIAPRKGYSRSARVGSYENYRQVAHAVRQRLLKAGREPRDLLDVHDFVWTTLRSAALGHLTG